MLRNVRRCITPLLVMLAGCGGQVSGDTGEADVEDESSITPLDADPDGLYAQGLDFGEVSVGQGAERTFVVKNNNRRRSETIYRVRTNAPFAVTGLSSPVTLRPGQSLELPVRFTPAEVGDFSGSLRVTLRDNRRQSVGLHGVATSGPADPTDPTDPTEPTDPTDPTDPTEPTEPTNPTDDGIFTLGERPFAASSSWNTPIRAGASYTRLNWPRATGYNYWVNWDGYSPAVYFSKPSDPLVSVRVPYSWGYPEQTIQIHVPAGVTGAAGTDAELIVIDGNVVHNFWQFKRTSTTAATCEAYGRADAVSDSGWGRKSPFLGAGIVAAGASQFAGLLVQAETDRGEIEHALQIALEFALQKPNPVGEAISSDGGSSTGISQEGERLAIPQGTAMPAGLSPLGQKVFRSMVKYGVFNIDVGGCTLLRAQNNAYDGNTIDALRTDMNKLMPLLQRVN